MGSERNYLDENEVADLIGCSVQTLRNHRYIRKGIPYSKFGRSVRYFMPDVLEYMSCRRIDPEADFTSK
jgi:hypothetical protein